jgi:plastocyanin
MKRNLFLFAFVFVLATKALGTTHTVTAADFSFTPSSFSMHLGDTVKWVWATGASAHTTTSQTIPSGAATWNSNLSSTTTSFTYVPTVLGTYNYHCTIHSSMTGSFTVVNGTGTNNLSVPAMISIFPNPAQAVLHVLVNSGYAPVSFTLTDMNGTLVAAQYSLVDGIDLDLQNIASGNYILRAVQGDKIYSQQIAVAH